MASLSQSLVVARPAIPRPSSSWPNPPRYLSQHHSFSTQRPHTPATDSVGASPDVLPPPPIQPRKPKVELRPAPIKTFSETSSSAARPPSPITAALSAKPARPPPPPSTTPSSAPSSVDPDAASLSSRTSYSTPAERERDAAQDTERTPLLRRAPPSRPSSPTSSIFKMAIDDLEIASRQGIMAPVPPDSGRLYKFWHQAKELFKFYWRGSLALWAHRGLVNKIQSRVRSEQKEGKEGLLSWRESQFIRTYREDRLKLVPFILIALLIEETLPLIIIYAPFLLPSTCILPSQQERIDQTKDDKKVKAFVCAKYLVQAMHNVEQERAQARIEEGVPAQNIARSIGESGIKGLTGELAWSACGIFSLATYGPHFLLQRRLRAHVRYLQSDDALLARGNIGRDLNERELRTALRERGFLTATLEVPEMQHMLTRWLAEARDEAGMLEVIMRQALETDWENTPAP
ncbi:hypothetical protein BOTBODRAFT_58302 [Botryobasidium botryosum FD-172 SS1]|uniref:Letm1 RBD domain-containing protein n=1 Tax=Botryobasidium botryosum (strain FD-172 SS1) TaxID=930990 RepID=A0A067MET5_BOTB1|nr:hypothetical protein BOTBODRAFT_58302 [Botryobasidium botryosum FD-172 SS1]